MANFNRVILAGNLTRDPELTYTASNVAVCRFGLAINRKWKDQQGNQKEEVCFVDIVAFGKQAEVVNQYMRKGRPLLVEGRLKYNQWTAKDGTNRSKLDVVAESFQFLGSNQAGGSGYAAPQGQYQPAPSHEQYDEPPPDGGEIPF